MSAIIYSITNETNGMMFIGQTSHTAEVRLAKDVRRVEAMFSHKQNPEKYPKHAQYTHLYQAMHFSGINNFSIKVLESLPADQVEALDDLEVKWINECNTKYPAGYNMVFGDQTHHHSIEMREKIKQGMIDNYENLRSNEKAKGKPRYMFYKMNKQNNKTYEYWLIKGHPKCSAIKSFAFQKYITDDDQTGEKTAEKACLDFLKALDS